MRERYIHIIRGQKNLLLMRTFLVACCLVLCAPSLHAQASKEYKIKAVFLFNFTQFVEWSPAAFPSPNAPFIIGVLGDDPFGQSLDETILNEKVNGHPLVVQRYRDVKDLQNCHILFINPDDPEKLREEIANVNGRATLTVSDAGNFLRMGGMIRFFTENNKIRLQINPDAAKASGLFISSKLLRVSDIFDPKSQPK